MVFRLHKISKLMQKDVKTIEEDEPISKAIEVMNFYKISCIVVTRKGSPTGIITERDLINRMLAKSKCTKKGKVKEVMTTPIVTKESNFPTSKIVKLMNDYMIRHVPIVNEGKVIGIVTQTDIVKYTQKAMRHREIALLTIVIMIIILINLVIR
ncbi:hypothetical protein C0585_08290 [Candidatus Woesearchaeota archaeon]|nr:MAG: hypothetical protein C0585_08290 [Candidatus Woesearchaeota archaeon]